MIGLRTYVISGVTVALLSAWALHERAHDADVRRAYTHAVDSVNTLAAARTATATARIATLQTALDAANGRVARGIGKAQVSAAKTQAVAGRVPAIVRDSFPVVDTLVIESQALVATVTQLRADLITQVAADSALHRVYAETVTAQSITIGTQLDRIAIVERQRDRRVGRWKVAGIALGTGALAFIAGSILGAP